MRKRNFTEEGGSIHWVGYRLEKDSMVLTTLFLSRFCHKSIGKWNVTKDIAKEVKDGKL